MIIKSTLLAVTLFLGSINLAEAQLYVTGGVPGPGTALGWNYGYIAYCQTFTDGVNTIYYAFFQGGGYGYTNNPTLIAFGSPACQTGNLVAVHGH
jgi:hypothetical protein